MATVWPNQMLEALGITPQEEQLYVILLDAPGQALPGVCLAANLSRAEARQVLARLENRGLVTRSASRSPRYVPAPPETALEILRLQRHEELEKTRGVTEQLQKRYARRLRREDIVGQVEIVTERLAHRRLYLQLLKAAKEEILVFAREAATDLVQEIRPDIRYRSVYEARALEDPDEHAVIEASGRAGEEIRLALSIPLELVIFDREVALVPLSSEESLGIVVIRSRPLIDGLLSLFEVQWSRAIPLPLVGSGEAEPSGVRWTEDEMRLLGLMAAGLKDRTIARQLGLAVRTVERRTSRILAKLGTTTRFQAGVLVAKRRLV